MKTYTLKDYINALTNENLIEAVNLEGFDSSNSILKIAHNSKNVVPNTLYICKGLNYKAEYLDEAIKRGASIYVAESQNISKPDFPHIIVNDIRKALAVISSLFYDYPYKKLNMIGITGTKGKSTTAYYIKSILDNYMKSKNLPDTAIVSSIDTYDGKTCKESFITSPESIDLQELIANAVDCKIQNLVMEVSSQALKLDRVYGIPYKFGIFLNISEDHISSIEHPDFDDYFNSKLKLFKQTEIACVNLDADNSNTILEHAKESKKVITFSTKNSKADVYGYNIKRVNHAFTTFRVKTSQFDKEFALAMPGVFNVENALAAICVAMAMNIPYENIYEALKTVRVSGRMESFVSKDGNTIIIVDYAHNKLSFEKLYSSTKQEYPGKKIITVFGCPGGKAKNRRKDMGTLAGIHSDFSYLTTDDPGPENALDICNEIANYIEQKNGEYKIIEDRGEAIKEAILNNPGCVILVAGKGNDSTQKCGTKYIPYLTDTKYAEMALKEYDEKN